MCNHQHLNRDFSSQNTMSQPNITIQKCLLLLLITLLSSFTFSTSQQTCDIDSGTYAPNSPYAANLNTLISSLSSNLSADGFSNLTVGQTPDTVNAIVMCRGDQNLTNCHTCVNSTARDLLTRCTGYKNSIFWNELCLVRYSNFPISGILRVQPPSRLPSTARVENPIQHDRELIALLESLKSVAVRSGPLKKAAAGNRSAWVSQGIFALVQCTPDISERDCIECLSDSIDDIPSCCGGVIGSGILRPSCTLRFENYRFYNESMVGEVPQVALPPPGKKDDNKTRILLATIIPVAVVFILGVGAIVFYRRRKQKLNERVDGIDGIGKAETLQFDFDVIRTATDNFSDDNKLGEGGFGAVYMGKLPNEQQIAVKRLSLSSKQGDQEFKNEVSLVAKLQHRNLVRMLGFCIQRKERLLVYEYVQNRSLDHFLFDPKKSLSLDWETRCKIIGGIARGLLYLHEDSRLRIIHRDLKASNVLLDGEMNPKISDFGMAKLFSADETQGTTSRVAGTYGYMAPEYAVQGQFSVKSDVFSFGMLVLEIVSGQKSTAPNKGEEEEDLLSYSWRNWSEGMAAQIISPELRSTSDSLRDIVRCIHIGLLCVQENPSDRPTMASVVLMLNSVSISMLIPSQPAPFMPRFVQESSSRNNTSENNVSITQLSLR